MRTIRQMLSDWFSGSGPHHHSVSLRRGKMGEKAAEAHLTRAGLRLLTRNFRTPKGEIDLILRDEDCLVFVEVKTRSSEDGTRPAAAVDSAKRRRLSLAASDYLRALPERHVKWRFDVVEVLMDGDAVREVRQLRNVFELDTRRPRRR